MSGSGMFSEGEAPDGAPISFELTETEVQTVASARSALVTVLGAQAVGPRAPTRVCFRALSAPFVALDDDSWRNESPERSA